MRSIEIQQWSVLSSNKTEEEKADIPESPYLPLLFYLFPFLCAKRSTTLTCKPLLYFSVFLLYLFIFF